MLPGVTKSSTCYPVSQEALRVWQGLEQEPSVPAAPQADKETAGSLHLRLPFLSLQMQLRKRPAFLPSESVPHIFLDTLDVSLMDCLFILEVPGFPTRRRVCVNKQQPPNCSSSCYLIPSLFGAGCLGTQQVSKDPGPPELGSLEQVASFLGRQLLPPTATLAKASPLTFPRLLPSVLLKSHHTFSKPSYLEKQPHWEPFSPEGTALSC